MSEPDFRSLLVCRLCGGPCPEMTPSRAAESAATGVSVPDDRWGREVAIMDGFMKAGAELAEKALSDRLKRYDLVLPMIFCYRHAIETWLKWLISNYGMAAEGATKNLMTQHDLLKLWEVCRAVILAYDDGDNRSDIDGLQHIVERFHELDRGGFSFRYATTTSGSLIDLPKDLDIANIREVMEGVANFFSGADGWLHHIMSV